MDKQLLDNPHLKENPFSVPEGYFQSVTDQWKKAPAPVPEPNEEGSRLWRFLRPQLQFAACFALLFGVGYGIMHLIGRPQTEAETDEVSALYEYLMPSTLDLEYLDRLDDVEAPLDLDEEDMVEYLGSSSSLIMEPYDLFENK